MSLGFKSLNAPSTFNSTIHKTRALEHFLFKYLDRAISSSKAPSGASSKHASLLMENEAAADTHLKSIKVKEKSQPLAVCEYCSDTI